MPEKNSNNRGFLKFGILTIVAVYFLILIGGVVRSTGSGMGCPDWPKCFGNFVPPVNKAQLPENYQEIYASKRFVKNKRLASIIRKLGFSDLAEKIVNDPSMYIEAEFNPVKTWIEYVNRLVGVAVGILIIGVVYYSISYLKSDKTIFWLSLLSLFLVIFEGWLGSIVVSTNLLPGTISVHMGLALLIVILLTYIIVRSHKSIMSNFDFGENRIFQPLLVSILILTFVQVLVGTQIREMIDSIAFKFPDDRGNWISHLSSIFPLHRILSVIILVLHLIFIYRLFMISKRVRLIDRLSLTLLIILFLEILTGLFLNYAGFPALLQPVHLLFANLLIGIQFLIYILIKNCNVNIKTA